MGGGSVKKFTTGLTEVATLGLVPKETFYAPEQEPVNNTIGDNGGIIGSSISTTAVGSANDVGIDEGLTEDDDKKKKLKTKKSSLNLPVKTSVGTGLST